MQGFRNILVGVDLSHADRLVSSELSPPTREAVDRGLWLAERNRARLTFCAVLDVSPQTRARLHGDYRRLFETVEAEANEALTRLVERAAQAGVTAESRLLSGTTWKELTRQALREQHDLVVVGTRDLPAPARLLFGSTAMKLLRHCPAPVWVTRPETDWEELTILVPSDFSDVSQQVLETAVNCGQMVNARLHLLHALEDVFGRLPSLTGVPDEKVEAWKEQMRADAEMRLYDQLVPTDHRTLTYGVQVHVEEGPAEIVILQAVEEYGAELVVLGTAARSGLSGLVIGNTAERLLSHVPCSVLAIKPADFVCPVSLDET